MAGVVVVVMEIHTGLLCGAALHPSVFLPLSAVVCTVRGCSRLSSSSAHISYIPWLHTTTTSSTSSTAGGAHGAVLVAWL